MTEKTDVLISLKPKYADSIFGGTKTVELRKRRPKIEAGTKVWIYTTIPTAAISGHANMVKIVSGSTSKIWKTWGQQTGVTKAEFDAYFKGRKLAHVLVLADIMRMKEALSLSRIREIIADFHPPQFYLRLNGNREKLRLSSRKYIPARKNNKKTSH